VVVLVANYCRTYRKHAWRCLAAVTIGARAARRTLFEIHPMSPKLRASQYAPFSCWSQKIRHLASFELDVPNMRRAVHHVIAIKSNVIILQPNQIRSRPLFGPSGQLFKQSLSVALVQTSGPFQRRSYAMTRAEIVAILQMFARVHQS